MLVAVDLGWRIGLQPAHLVHHKETPGFDEPLPFHKAPLEPDRPDGSLNPDNIEVLSGKIEVQHGHLHHFDPVLKPAFPSLPHQLVQLTLFYIDPSDHSIGQPSKFQGRLTVATSDVQDIRTVQLGGESEKPFEYNPTS